MSAPAPLKKGSGSATLTVFHNVMYTVKPITNVFHSLSQCLSKEGGSSVGTVLLLCIINNIG